MPAVMQIQGLRELKRDLRRLGQEVGSVVIADALDEGAEIFESAIRRRAPVRRGVLRDSFVVRQSKRNRHSSLYRKGIYRAGVGWRKSGSHAMPVEFGHRIVRGGKVVGHVPAHPFIRPAFDAAKSQAEHYIEEALRRGLDQRWGR